MDTMMSITFSNPQYLSFLLIIPLIILMHFLSLKGVRGKILKFANFEAIVNIPVNNLISRKYVWLLFKVVIIFLLILSIAGAKINYSGYSPSSNFVLTIDVSSSMSIEDYSPNRLEAVKESTGLFLDKIPAESKVGLVSFSGGSFIESKLTGDKSLIKSSIKNLNVSKIGGTDIGEAIINSVNVLLLEEEKSRIVILLSDGQSNVGTPVNEGIEYAKRNGIVIYTVGVGTKEGGSLEDTKAILKLDEETLKKIADETEGKYFKATGEKEIKEIYEGLGGKSEGKMEINLSQYLLLLVLILLLIMWGIGIMWYRSAP